MSWVQPPSLNSFNRHIFATPPPNLAVATDMWSEEEWERFVIETLIDLKSENEKEKSSRHPLLFDMNRGVGTDLVWAASEEFGLHIHCKYIAMDLFNRYIVMQTQSLLEHILKDFRNIVKQEKRIKELENRVRAQAPLRALTCVMIASKLVSHKMSVNAKMLQKFMLKLKMTYNLKQILSSEIRVLKQLDYRCLQTNSLMVYNGMVIAALKLWGGLEQRQAECLREVSLCLLDIAYLNHEKLYRNLFLLITGSRVIPENLKPAFAPIVADRFLLAASTVVGSAWIIEGESLCNAIISCICDHIHLSADDVESMTSCLLDSAKVSSVLTKM